MQLSYQSRKVDTMRINKLIEAWLDDRFFEQISKSL